MFAKVFTQILDSSLAEDYQTRLVFEDLLKLCDASGVVDMTHESISRRTNVPLEIVKRGIAELEKPDLRSRNANHEGRRIVRLDDHRDWGWLIVNYEHYRAIASEDQRRAKTAERVKRWKEKRKGNAEVTHGNAGNAMQREKEMKREKEEGVTSENIYQAYPKKVGKPEALRAIAKALKKVSAERLLAFTQAYTEARNGDLAFCPNPATWFNQERFNDDPSTWIAGSERKPPNQATRPDHSKGF